ncbi:MAG: hypothetical protein FWC20_04705 [Oscillospiraceae bacterium]|nr:hypothetical protein [Oscillospiraceae bacterium]MCL2278694.1 hypothetical protein [Oscillospiraceae bacterium]
MRKKLFKLATLILVVVMLASVALPIASAGRWRELSRDNWYWEEAGNAWALGWRQIDGTWYFFHTTETMWLDFADQGLMARDQVVPIGNSTFMFSPTGAMVTGWVNMPARVVGRSFITPVVTGQFYWTDGIWTGGTRAPLVAGAWYYFNADGTMARNQWVQDGDNWHRLGNDGRMLTGWNTIWDGGANQQFYLGDNGVMRTGWQRLDNLWYFFRPNGHMARGWLEDGGVWYFLRTIDQASTTYPGGSMVAGPTNNFRIGDDLHAFASNGAWLGRVGPA